MCANHLAKSSCLGLRFRYFRCSQTRVSGPTREQYKPVGLLEAFYLTSVFSFFFFCFEQHLTSGAMLATMLEWDLNDSVPSKSKSDEPLTHREVLQQVAKYMYSFCSNTSLYLRKTRITFFFNRGSIEHEPLAGSNSQLVVPAVAGVTNHASRRIANRQV